MSFQATQLIGFGAVTEGPTLVYVGSVSSTSDTDTYTFSSAAIGAAIGDRLVIVGAGGRGGDITITGITIGGSPATLHVAPSGDLAPTAIASLAVPTGTTADIVVTFSGAMSNAAIFVWTLTGYQSATPTATNGLNDGDGTSKASTMNIPANGQAVYVAWNLNGAAMSWSNATERDDSSIEAGASRGSNADFSTILARTAYAVTASWSGTTRGGISGAAWN